MELTQRGPLMMIGLDGDDEAAIATLLQANVDAMTGPTAIVTTMVRELERLANDPEAPTGLQPREYVSDGFHTP